MNTTDIHIVWWVVIYNLQVSFFIHTCMKQSHSSHKKSSFVNCVCVKLEGK